MLRVTTQNSVYEIDEDGRRVRRVEGSSSPTANFAHDGEWHDYANALLCNYGTGQVYVFQFRDERSTITSYVENVEHVELYCEALTYPGSYYNPPEYCESEVAPGSSYCEYHDPDRIDDARIERAELLRSEPWD